jgi:hypothetical protein
MPWRRLPFEGLERALWRPGWEAAHQRLWVNGLLGESAHETIYSRRYATEGPWVLETADVMVFDGRGQLPLAVTRDHLEGHAPYHDVLRRDILLGHCAWLLARAALPPAAEVPQAPMWQHYDGMSPGDGTLIAPPSRSSASGGRWPGRNAIALAEGERTRSRSTILAEITTVISVCSRLPNFAYTFIPCIVVM